MGGAGATSIAIRHTLLIKKQPEDVVLWLPVVLYGFDDVSSHSSVKVTRGGSLRNSQLVNPARPARTASLKPPAY